MAKTALRQQPQGGQGFPVFWLGSGSSGIEPRHHGEGREMATLSVPDHNPVAKGTLRGLIRAAGLTVDEFVGAL